MTAGQQVARRELAERYSNVSVDPPDFTDKRVLIIWPWETPHSETADNLVETASVVTT